MRLRVPPGIAFCCLAICIPLAIAQSSANSRTAWLYSAAGSEGWLKQVAAKTWRESTADGLNFDFEETARNADFIELFDPSRSMKVRLHGDRLEWRKADAGPWNRLYEGRWVKPAELRDVWLYRQSGKIGSFLRDAGRHWVETTPPGDEHEFEETARRADHVELFDRGRKMRLRLYRDRIEFREGDAGAWNRLYDGRWGSADELPQRRAPDYRIRLVYFVPSDREPTANYADKIRVVMHFVSELYRQDIAAHGIRSAGLRFQSENGRPVVHLVRSRRPAAYFSKSPNFDKDHNFASTQPEIPSSIGSPNRNVLFVFSETYDPGPAATEWPGAFALGGRFSTDGGLGVISSWMLRPEFCATTVAEQRKLLFDMTPIKGRTSVGTHRSDSPRSQFIQDGFGAVAHELGHALGLPHDFRKDKLCIMGNGFRQLRYNFLAEPDEARRCRFSDDNARILYTSRYLASDTLLSDRIPPTVECSLPGALKVGDTSVRVRVRATDNEGLRAALFFSLAEDSVVGGRALSGKRQEFEQTLTVRPLVRGEFRLKAIVADVGGNLGNVEVKKVVEP